MRLLMIDHLDSFTFNLVDAFRCLGAEVEVIESPLRRKVPVGDKEGSAQPGGVETCGVILSPGPGRPEHYPQTLAFLSQLPANIPVLGVCLGMQCLCEWSGGEVVHAPQQMHGKTSRITHDGRGLFEKIPSPCEVMRYHSLACRVTSPDWKVCAWTEDEVPMGIRHCTRPWHAVQFHPESFLTPEGKQMLRNFVEAIPCR